MTSVGENYTLQFGNKHRTVFVAEAVVNTWRKNKQTKINQSEMCGVLIGATSRDKKTIWVESVTSALPLDVRYRYNFVMKDPGHQVTIDNAHHTSGGTEIYLGTWHTHPENYPNPSTVDTVDWKKCMRRNRSRPLVFVIVGILETRIFCSNSGKFRRLQPFE